MIQTDRSRQTIEFDCTRFSAGLLPPDSNTHYPRSHYIQHDFRVFFTLFAISFLKYAFSHLSNGAKRDNKQSQTVSTTGAVLCHL